MLIELTEDLRIGDSVIKAGAEMSIETLEEFITSRCAKYDILRRDIRTPMYIELR